ncbi:MAG TPA: arylsulfatase [Gemmataceae bacterium]|nr:arylsulfatase [Gemmataceae bacterium]
MSRTLAAVLILIGAVGTSGAEPDRKPNIVFILADDLGYGDVGCYGQKMIRTPNIDRMAAEGIRFTQCYAGSTVCAPSRCCLMTGFHTGHGRVRGNALVPLQPEDRTVAEVLKAAGYATGLSGKWGLGEADSTGIPNKKGFDFFFGYLNQNHAHAYYPDFLWKNQEKVPLPNVVKNNVASKKVVYSPDLITKEALGFIEANKDRPFFLYFAPTLPHANNEAKQEGMEIPSDEPYTKETWPQPQKNHAAMITRLDADVGKVLDKLKELKLDENTIVFFSSDNGPHKEGGGDPAFFNSSGGLRGYKRSMTEGGIRVPMIVRWPGKVKPGESDFVWAFWDFLPTAAALAGAKIPSGLDGQSVSPVLLGTGDVKPHEFLYWEFHEGGSKQAVRTEDWKAIRNKVGGPLELYDLRRDIGEQENVAARHADVVVKVEEYLKTARGESKEWPLRAGKKK